ncbi:hypothetical protein EDD90_2825 [Streptomyces sp. Ag109_O5-1]|nr:hypothetical protein EDD90_2825 [Streptomyces sp. Ag109_O5-1]
MPRLVTREDLQDPVTVSGAATALLLLVLAVGLGLAGVL